MLIWNWLLVLLQAAPSHQKGQIEGVFQQLRDHGHDLDQPYYRRVSTRTPRSPRSFDPHTGRRITISSESDQLADRLNAIFVETGDEVLDKLIEQHLNRLCNALHWSQSDALREHCEMVLAAILSIDWNASGLSKWELAKQILI